MSDTTSRPAPALAAPQQTDPYAGLRALLRAGRNDEAIVRLCALTVTRPDDLVAKELLFDAFFQKRDYPPAFALINELVRGQPDNVRLQRHMIVTLNNMKRYQEAIPLAARFAEQHGESLTILDVLKVANFYTGKVDEAVRYGQRGIEIRDAEACRLPRDTTLGEPSSPPAGDNVIAFSLWGAQPFYSYGAMINLKLSRSIYPGWSCRFYVGADVPRAVVAFLADNGADVRKIEDEYPGVGLFQRFLVMNDRSVGHFLVRDCDARVSPAEADLVRQWIESGYPFHVVRDHVLHNELMIGCLWGGRTDCGIDIVALMHRYFGAAPNARYGHDQFMLGRLLWPIIRERCLVHDKYYRLAGVHTVGLTDPQSHFGAGHQNIAAVRAEAEKLGIPRVL
jgi:tetratricopeptide (TPR) repeat protein